MKTRSFLALAAGLCVSATAFAGTTGACLQAAYKCDQLKRVTAACAQLTPPSAAYINCFNSRMLHLTYKCSLAKTSAEKAECAKLNAAKPATDPVVPSTCTGAPRADLCVLALAANKACASKATNAERMGCATRYLALTKANCDYAQTIPSYGACKSDNLKK